MARSYRPILFLLLGFSLFYWFGLTNHYLLLPDEARYAEIAREMLVHGNFVTPLVNNMIFFDKPAMYYWLTALAIKIFGATELAARFFPALIAIIGIISTFIFTRFITDTRTGILAALILGSAPLFWGAAHYSNMDLLVAMFVTLSLYCFWVGIHHTNKKIGILILYTSYIFSAIAILTKGALGLAFPCMIIGLWMLFCKQWRILLKMRLPTGLALVALIVFPWFYLVQKQNPEFLHYFFVVQQWQRFLTSHFNNQEGVWFYPAIIFLGFLPWSIFIFTAVYQAFKKIKNKTNVIHAIPFLLIWFFSILIFFSIPHSKLLGYILPTFPPMAILLAIHINALWGKSPNVFSKIFISLFILTVLSETILITTLTKEMNKYSSKPIAEKIEPFLTKDTTIVTIYHNYNDINFYTGFPIYIFSNWDDPTIMQKDSWKTSYLYAAQHRPDQAKYLLSSSKLQQLWNNHDPVIVIIESKILYAFPYKTYHAIAKTDRFTALSNV